MSENRLRFWVWTIICIIISCALVREFIELSMIIYWSIQAVLFIVLLIVYDKLMDMHIKKERGNK